MIQMNDMRQVMTPIKLVTMVAAATMRRDLSLYMQRGWSIIDPAVLRWNWHLDAICEHLLALSLGQIRYLAICIPPRMSKSSSCTILWPTWHWIEWPQEQFICASYSSGLALEHSLQSRRIIEAAWYQQFWGDRYYLLPDENRNEMYRNSKGGYRLTTSVGGRTTGEGGSLQLLDDPVAADAVESDATRASTLSWHDNAWRSRVNDPNTARKLYVAQRTHDADIMGHIQAKEAHRWVFLTLPMEFDVKRKCITYANDGTGPNLKQQLFEDPRKVEGELLNPKRFNKATARAEKEGGMSDRAWNAQYQQQPEGQGGLILKRAWWRSWVYGEGHSLYAKEMPMPEFFEIIQVYDTAFEKQEQNDFSARTTWGLFIPTDEQLEALHGHIRGVQRRRKDEEDERLPGQGRVSAIMLDRLYDRLEYPELRDEMIQSNKDFAPDKILVEKKASGHSLIQEGRRHGLPMVAVKVEGDLESRVHAASLMLKKGCIYFVPRAWSYEVQNIAAKFPMGDHDDLESTLSMAWQYMRQYHGLQLPDDETQEEIAPFRWQRKSYA